MFLQPTTQARPTTTSRISQLSRMPVSELLSPTSYVKTEESLSRKTLLDSASAVVQCSGAVQWCSAVVQTALRTLANKNREINVLGLKT